MSVKPLKNDIIRTCYDEANNELATTVVGASSGTSTAHWTYDEVQIWRNVFDEQSASIRVVTV